MAPGQGLGARDSCVSRSLPLAIPMAVSPGTDRVELGRNLNPRESKPAGITLQRCTGEQTGHWLQESGGPPVALALEGRVACTHDISFLGLDFFIFSMTEADWSALSNIGWRCLADVTELRPQSTELRRPGSGWRGTPGSCEHCREEPSAFTVPGWFHSASS